MMKIDEVFEKMDTSEENPKKLSRCPFFQTLPQFGM